MVYVRFRLANENNFLDIIHMINPDIEGIKPTRRASWKESEWHKDNIVSYPEKLKYIEKLKTWANNKMSDIEAGFSVNPGVSHF